MWMVLHFLTCFMSLLNPDLIRKFPRPPPPLMTSDLPDDVTFGKMSMGLEKLRDLLPYISSGKKFRDLAFYFLLARNLWRIWRNMWKYEKICGKYVGIVRNFSQKLFAKISYCVRSTFEGPHTSTWGGRCRELFWRYMDRSPSPQGERYTEIRYSPVKLLHNR